MRAIGVTPGPAYGLTAAYKSAPHHRAIGVVVVVSTLVFALMLPFARELLPRSVRVRQVLGNLLSNAIKYASEGPITIESRPRGDRMAVSVIDSGPGIVAAKAESIFQEFTRLDPGAPHGSGIGLAISRRIARLLGGDLALEGAGGDRSMFTLWLPR